MVDDINALIKKQLAEASSGVPELGIPPLDLPELKRADTPAVRKLAQMEEQEQSETIPSGMPEAPAPTSGEEPITLLTEDIEQISEAIISEKWKVLTKDIENMRRWQEMAERNMQILNDNLLKIEQRIGSLEQSVFQRVEEYGKGISDVGTELQAMQKVFKAMMPEFTSNIKEFSELVRETKDKVKTVSPRLVEPEEEIEMPRIVSRPAPVKQKPKLKKSIRKR